MLVSPDKLRERRGNPVERNYQGSVELVVQDDLNMIIEEEIKRVQFYLNELGFYREHGYLSILRWPDGLDLALLDQYSPDNIRSLIEAEVKNNAALYADFAQEHREAFALLLNSGVVQIAANLYGIPIAGQFRLYPTAYGTIASPFNIAEDIPAFFRLPTFVENAGALFVSGRDRSVTERLVHEIFAHTVTQTLRLNTTISDDASCKYPGRKERLMDLFGRTILVECGLMDHQGVAMQVRGVGVNGEVAALVDSLYYLEDGEQLRYRGDVETLIRNLDKELLET